LALAGTWLMRNPGWGVSIALHAAAAAVVGYLVVRAQLDTQSKGIEALFSQPGEVIAFDQVGIESALNAQSADSPVIPLVGVGEQGGAGDESASLANLMNSAGSGSGQSSGDGQEGGAEPGLGAAFFGSQAEGKTFVYVVDMSGSMYGPRFERAKTELCSSLNKLKPQQKFYVYFFSDRTLPMMSPRPPRGLLAASKSNREKATRWVRSREPGGLTNPLPALRQALDMRPEVIFLLTDGEVDNPTELKEQIRKLNKSKTTIHTLAFESEEGEETLKAIAAEHNGTYRFVR
ncbi:MAG: VWA domain-containing protein, partial [Planctomycetaceae bacterium]